MRRIAAGLLVLAAGLAVGAAPAWAAPVAVGQSGWSWGSPRPQGNSLFAIDFASGGRGYAAGAFGTVLRTEDAGVTWSGIATGRTTDFTRLAVLGPDAFVVGGGCTLRRSDDGGRTFKRLPFAASETGCPSGIAALSFPSAQVGMLVLGDGTVLRTDDGGETFARRTSIPATRSAGGSGTPGEALFFSSDSGVAIVRVGPDTQIHRTADGGGTWAQVAATSAHLATLHQAPGGPLYAGGHGNTLLRSTDGGVTWEARALAGAPATGLTSVRCGTPDVCLMATLGGARLLRTADGGATVEVLTAASEPLRAVAFADAARAVAVGDRGVTVASSDGGHLFARAGGDLPGRYTRIRAAGGDLAFATGARGALARTTDGGTTWIAGAVSTSLDVLDVAFSSPTSGFALDVGGTLLRTDNAGASWRILGSGPGGRATSVLTVGARTVVLAGTGGLRRSANGGALFDRVGGAATRRSPLVELDRAGAAVLAYGRRALFVTSDGGRRWRAIKRPYKRAIVSAADFVSARIGFVLDDRGRVLKTRNGGRRWTELLGAGGAPVSGLAFSDSRSGWLVLSGFRGSSAGWVLRTDDGGRSFRPQLVSPTTLDARAFGTPTLAALGARRGVAFSPGEAGPDDEYSGGSVISGPQSFFATTTGGDAGREPRLSLRRPRGQVRRGRAARITGRLNPAEGGEQVVVSLRSKGSIVWQTVVVTAASDGRFSLTRKLGRTTFAVAQWSGDDERAGAASTVVTVPVG